MAKSLRQLQIEYIYLLEDINANLKAQLDFTRNGTRSSQEMGVVYVIRQVGTNNYKIGLSTNYKARKSLFTVKLPFEIEEVLVYETDQYRELEQALHSYFAAYRLNNSEFFDLTPEQVQQIPATIDELLADINTPKEQPVAELEPVEDPAVTDDKDAAMMERVHGVLATFNLSPADVSVSFLQRKLSVGYARAARLKDRLIDEVLE